MLAHKNGQYPLSLFIHRGGNLYFTPSLNARWNEMVRLGVEKYGVRLWVTGDVDGLGGWNVYRPLLAQRRYRRHYGVMAAVEGTSSHGGKYRGEEVFALDIANVDALAPGNPSLARARLSALAKVVGLRVNFVTPTEWWHVGDFNNAWKAPVFGQVAVNPGTTNKPIPLPEGTTMNDVKQIHWMNGSKVGGRALIIPGTAWAVPFTENGSTYANRAAAQFKTGNSEEYTKSLFDAFIAAAARCAPSALKIETVQAD